jgi:hypothetical protein
MKPETTSPVYPVVCFIGYCLFVDLRTLLCTVELGYNVMKWTEYFVSL